MHEFIREFFNILHLEGPTQPDRSGLQHLSILTDAYYIQQDNNESNKPKNKILIQEGDL